MTATLTTTPEAAATLRVLEELFGHDTLTNVGFRLWDGTPWPDDRPRMANLILNHPGALRQMFSAGTEKALAEAYLYNDFDIEGDIESAFELAEVFSRRSEHWIATLRTYLHLRRLPGNRPGAGTARSFSERDDHLHSIPRDREAVSFHYDLSNDFYRLWLDQRMVYSCAYFERQGMSLDEAQEAKLRHICRKLRLQSGQRLLDIGCGWGGLAIYAAQHFQVHVTGVTLSEAQAELGRERARAAGLQERVNIELRDYRELPTDQPFDAIVSVGMAEHVGRTMLPAYFRMAALLLRPGGVFLNHAIGEGVIPRKRVGPSFIESYVFPDSDIPPIPTMLQAAESAGFEVRDVENLREHYAQTLRHWVSRLEGAHDSALRYVTEPTYRIWRLYMAGSAHGFDCGHLAIYQALLSKPDQRGHSHLPRTRADWYPNA